MSITLKRTSLRIQALDCFVKRLASGKIVVHKSFTSWNFRSTTSTLIVSPRQCFSTYSPFNKSYHVSATDSDSDGLKISSEITIHVAYITDSSL